MLTLVALLRPIAARPRLELPATVGMPAFDSIPVQTAVRLRALEKAREKAREQRELLHPVDQRYVSLRLGRRRGQCNHGPFWRDDFHLT